MTVQYSVAVRNAKLDAFETTAGTSAILKIRTGAAPAACANTDTGSVLATCSLPSDWMSAANNGVKIMTGSWSTSSANNSGTAGHFRIYDSGGTNCHMQGTVTATGGGGDMTVDNTSFASGQAFSVTSFSITAGNA